MFTASEHPMLAALTPTLIGKELHALIAHRAAKSISEVEPDYEYKFTREFGRWEIQATYRENDAQTHGRDDDLVFLDLNDFSGRYLAPLANRLVPAHQSLMDGLDALWFCDIRPKLISMAKKFSEENNA